MARKLKNFNSLKKVYPFEKKTMETVKLLGKRFPFWRTVKIKLTVIGNKVPVGTSKKTETYILSILRTSEYSFGSMKNK